MKLLNIDIFQSVINFFETIKTNFSLEYLLYIFIGLEILTIIVFSIIAHNVYEMRLTRAIDKINAYLYDVQYINESNLIEFNNMMKRVPKTLRYHWQQYMLNRDKAPSEYMSVVNCIDRPLKSSSLSANIKVAKTLSYIYAVLSLIFSCGIASSQTDIGAGVYIIIFAIPAMVLLLNYIFTIALDIRKASNTNELYQTFHIFNRFIDKAVSTMPSYVDFEVLFTAKEIKRGIPVLNEYIEKRQLQEQEEMKKARENAIQHELYNFEEAGEKGELVLERAMKETEIFVNMRNRLNTEIDQFDKEMDSLKRSFENTTKDYQKKLQASKENTDRLREQQEATTNRVESNYIRKQQADEIKKQQQIEKDQEDAQLRFNQEINNLAAEIKKRKEELEEARLNVEKSMLAEYKTFSNKIYAEIRENVNEHVKEEREELIGSREEVARELEKAMTKIDTLEIQNKVLVNKAAEREAYVKASVEKEKRELQARLNEKQEQLEEKEKQIQLISSNYILNENQPKPSKKESKAAAKVATEEVFEKIEIEEPKPDQFGGQFDENGNYTYPSGAYYDAQGNLHENGKVYDKDGILIEDNSQEEAKQEKETEVEVVEEAANEVVEATQEIEEAANEVVEATQEIEEAHEVSQEIDGFDAFANEVSQDEIAPEENVIVEESESVEELPTDEQPQEAVAEPEEISEEVEEKPEAKKRGRPRKEKPEEEPKPAGKRGRPRKVVSEEEKPEAKKRGRPRKETVEAEESKAEEPAKKRGRPRKETSDEETVKPAGKRGRPRKETVEAKELKAEEPVKKRGRPRKETSEEETVKPAGKRGRPRKETQTHEEAPNAEPKKRGRPKKLNIDENLKLIEERLKEQNRLLKEQQKALDKTVNGVNSRK